MTRETKITQTTSTRPIIENENKSSFECVKSNFYSHNFLHRFMVMHSKLSKLQQ